MTTMEEALYQLGSSLSSVPEEQLLSAVGFFVAVIMGVLAYSAVCTLLRWICRWRIFTKAGEKGWKGLIPLYNTYLEYGFTWNTKFFFLMAALFVSTNILGAAAAEGGFITFAAGICGLASTLITLIQRYKLAAAFGHGIGFSIGLCIFEPIFLIILAFGKSEYIGPNGMK